MKKLLTLLFAVGFIFSLSACGGGSSKDESANGEATEEVAQPSDDMEQPAEEVGEDSEVKEDAAGEEMDNGEQTEAETDSAAASE